MSSSRMPLPPRAEPRRGQLTPLEPDDCWALLDTTSVGRLAFSTDEGVVILPVNFVLFDSAVYFRTNPGTVIAKLGDGCDDVAFEVDHHEDLFQRGWNVLVHGSTSTVVDPEEVAAALASSPRIGPWAPGERSLVIKLSPDRIAGRRVSLR